MAKDYSQLLSTMLITLRNINDHLKVIEENVTSAQVDKNSTFKHIVVIKPQEPKKECK